MIFKLCFAQQIHRCPKAPESYEGLRAVVKQTFKEALPENFSLSYVDQDGDRVILQAEDDFSSMIESVNQQANKAVKIFITAEGQDEIPEDMMNSRIAISKDNIEDPFQVLLNKKDGHEKPVEEKIKEVPEVNEAIIEEAKKEEPKPVEPVIEVSTILIDKKEPEASKEEAPKEIEQEVKKEAPKIVEKYGEAREADDDDRIDLTDKKALRAFILQTIEEAMPQIMANYFSNKSIDEKKHKDENSVVQGIKNVASEITSKVEKIVIGEKEGLNAKISKVEKIIPEIINTTDDYIYVTVTFKNNGSVAFPQKAFLQNTGGLFGDMIQVPPLESRKEFKTTIIVKGPKKAGNYHTKWRFGYIDERNVTKHFGEELEVKFNVVEKKYSKEVHEKARTLKEVIPETDISVFLEFVSQDPKKPVELLIEEFLLNNPSK